MLAEDEANEMSSDLARMKRLAGKLAEENKRLTEELNEIQKVGSFTFMYSMVALIERVKASVEC